MRGKVIKRNLGKAGKEVFRSSSCGGGLERLWDMKWRVTGRMHDDCGKWQLPKSRDRGKKKTWKGSYKLKQFTKQKISLQKFIVLCYIMR